MASAIILWIIVSLLFLVGLAGTIIPGLPGIGLVFAGVLVYGFATDFTTISVWFTVAAGGAALLAVAADYAGSVWGARVGGGKWKAATGAVVGVIVGGLTLGPPGIFLGAFAGGFAGALAEGATHARALKTAGVSVVGIVASAVIQFLLAISIIVAFFIAVFV